MYFFEILDRPSHAFRNEFYRVIVLAFTGLSYNTLLKKYEWQYRTIVTNFTQQILQAATAGSLLFNIRVEYSVFVIVFGL